jgi:hypothetical protein
MTSIIDMVLMSSKLQKQHIAMKNLFGSEFDAKIEWYVTTLQTVMAQEGISILQAVLFVNKLESVKENDMAKVLFNAAAVDMMERESKNKDEQKPR